MKYLESFGLVNPKFELQYTIGEENRKYVVRLSCDNSFKNLEIAKVFSYFQKVFEKFILQEIEDGLYEKYDKVKNFNEIHLHNPDLAEPFLRYAENLFNAYLESNSNKIEEKLKLVQKEPAPKINWRTAPAGIFVKARDDDEENGYLFHCLIPEKATELKNSTIDHDSEIQAMIENILYEEQIEVGKISVYYSVFNHDDLTTMPICDDLKRRMERGSIIMTLICFPEKGIRDFKKQAFLREPKYAYFSTKEI